MAVFNCHLEAFNARNREVQAPILIGLVDDHEADAWVVMGDMNALPPESPQFSGFADEPEWDGTNDRTIDLLRRGLGQELPPSHADDPGMFTFPAGEATRRLDYIFSSETLLPRSARILAEEGRTLSDHLPIVAVVGGVPDLRPSPPGATPIPGPTRP